MESIKIDKANALYDERIHALGGDCITIFTPTYNRSGLLMRVYECLKEQSNNRFVWLVVCDGSTDDTDEKMMRLVDESGIPLRYVSKGNGGKHTALKLGMEVTETKYFCDCDDDDTYTPDMVDFFLKVWSQIESEGRDDIGAVRSLTQNVEGKIVCGYDFDLNEMGRQFDATTLEMEYVRYQHQENQTCYSTKALRSVDIWPTDYWLSNHHTFLSEGIWQGRLARKYKCRYVYKVTRMYNETTEGLMRGKMDHQRAINTFLNYHMLLNEQWDYISRNKRKLLKQIGIMGAFRSFAGISVFEQMGHIIPFSLKCWTLMAAPFCYLLCKIKLRG